MEPLRQCISTICGDSRFLLLCFINKCKRIGIIFILTLNMQLELQCQNIIGCFVSSTRSLLSLNSSSPLLPIVRTIAVTIAFLSGEYVSKPILSFNHYASSFWVDHSEMSCNNRDRIKKVPWQYLVFGVQLTRSAIMAIAV